jgi:hypothetical protein
LLDEAPVPISDRGWRHMPNGTNAMFVALFPQID